MLNFAIKCLLLLACSLAGLVACGGGSSGAPLPATLSGKAAVGYPIVGATITVVCSAGSTLPTTRTDSSGAWQLSVTGQTLPCKVQVSAGTVNGVANARPYHSVAWATGTVNVTPLTDLLVAHMVGNSPLAWFGDPLQSSFGRITQSAVGVALAQMRSALPVLNALAGLNPITSAFSASAGNAMDDMLALVQVALGLSDVNYDSLLLSFTLSAIAPPAAFSSALASPAPAADTNQCVLNLGTQVGGAYCNAASVGDWHVTTHNSPAATQCDLRIAAGLITLSNGTDSIQAGMDGNQDDQLIFTNRVISSVAAHDTQGAASSAVSLLFVNGILASASAQAMSSGGVPTSLNCLNIL